MKIIDTEESALNSCAEKHNENQCLEAEAGQIKVGWLTTGGDEHQEEPICVSLCLYTISGCFCEGCACHRGASGPPEEVGWCGMEVLRLWAGPWSHHQLCALAWADLPYVLGGLGLTWFEISSFSSSCLQCLWVADEESGKGGICSGLAEGIHIHT